MVVASENSVHKLLELLPGKVLNGEKVDVRPATRQNLSQFEAQARKRECVRVPRGGTWRLSVWGEVWVCSLWWGGGGKGNTMVMDDGDGPKRVGSEGQVSSGCLVHDVDNVLCCKN